MKTNARCSRFHFVLLLFLTFAGYAPAQTARQTVRVSPATTVPFVTADRLRPVVTTLETNRMLEIKVPKNSAILVRRDGKFVSPTNSRVEGTNLVYAIQPTDVYVARGKQVPPVALSTNAVRLPDTIQAVVNGQQIEGYVEVALQSELMVYDPDKRNYKGTLDICFRSPHHPELAKKLVPLGLRLSTTPGLQLSTNAITLDSVGYSGCRDVAIECASLRSGAKVTVKSDALGNQEFLVNFEAAAFNERYKTVLVISGGVCLGSLGGLIRNWQIPKSKRNWRRIAEGGFCGLILVLLGEIGVKQLFKMEGPLTTSVLLGFCGVLGYFGVRLFERFVPSPSAKDKSAG